MDCAHMNVTVNVKYAPVLKAAMDLCHTAQEIYDAIPDYVPEREELMKRLDQLADAIKNNLTVRSKE